MFDTIREIHEMIAAYKQLPKGLVRHEKWFECFAAIRKAYYAQEITWEQYEALMMDELGFE